MRGRNRFTCPDRGRAQVGAPTYQRPGPQDWASAGTSCAAAEAVQCPPTLEHSTSYYPHLPRPVWARGLPTNLPTRLENAAATGKGWGPATLIVIRSPAHPQVKSGRRSDIGQAWQEARTREIFQGWEVGRALQEQQGWGAGPCFLAPLVSQSRSICQNRAHIAIGVPFHPEILSCPSQAPARRPTACSCVQGELGSPRPNFIRCQPTCTAPHAANAARGTPRAPRAAFGVPSVRSRECWQGSALDVFPTQYREQVPIHVCPVRPFLARFLYSLMRATNKQASKQAPKPAGLPPAWSPAPGSLSFFARS